MNLSIKKNSKSAQASIEFLMTYGWMILIVLIVGVLVFSFINFGSLLPTKVELSGSFKGDPSRVVASSGDSGVLQVLVKYAGANSVIINDAKDISLDIVDSKNCSFYSMTDSTGNIVDESALDGNREILFINGQESLITFDCSKGTEFVEGDILQGDIRIKYSDSRNPGLDLTSTGEIRVAISDMSINLTELANGESNKNGESSEDDPALSVECYSSSNVGKIGTSGVCEGMLIVDNDLIHSAASEYVGGDESFELLGPDGNIYTFENSNFNIYTGQVKDMKDLFKGTNFNSDINYWEVSNVESMYMMFLNASSFNKPLNDWEVSNVKNMKQMFRNVNSFNQPLNDWDVSSVTDMQGMFVDVTNFNQPLSDWDVSNVRDMSYMFFNAQNFNQPLNDWDVSNVVNAGAMFRDAQNFNQPLNNWDVSNVKYMYYMFYIASSFNQDIGDWDVSSVTNMVGMFSRAEFFNQPLDSWDVSNVENMSYMFYNAYDFNQPLNNWDVSNVENMSYMFYDSDSFNQDLTQWCVSQFESEPSGFASNPPLESSNKPKWGESCEENLNSACYDPLNVGTIGTEGVCKDMLIVDEDMLRGAEEIDGGVDMRINYSDGESTIEFTFGDSDFNVFTGQVTDMRNLFRSTSFNSDINYWDVSNVEDIRLMFYDVESFNQPLNNWDVSNVEDMGYVFRDTNFFNQPLDNWDVSSATDMNGMFRDANNFNQPLDSWDVSNVTSMSQMFYSADSFNQPLNSWDVSSVTSMSQMFQDAAL